MLAGVPWYTYRFEVRDDNETTRRFDDLTI
jgi:hypothetical protein